MRLEYLTAKLRALEREIDGILTQEVLVTAGCPEGAASDEAGTFRSLSGASRQTCDQVFEENLRVEGEKVEG